MTESDQVGFRDPARSPARDEQDASAAIDAAIAAAGERRVAQDRTQRVRARIARLVVQAAMLLLVGSIVGMVASNSRIPRLLALVAVIFLIFAGLWRLMTHIEPKDGTGPHIPPGAGSM